MSTFEEAQDIFVSAQQNELAAKIIDGLDRLDEKPESSAKRWIWELIQNAKDASLGSRPVQIEIIRTQGSVEFKHSGNPFTLKDLVSIICQTSLKERSEDENEIPENTGKFGTGFITTHLLSRKIQIKGIYKKIVNKVSGTAAYQNFSLILDRATANKEEMIRKTKETQKIFKNLDNEDEYPYLASYELGKNCDTSFIYPLEGQAYQIAEDGINDFRNSIFQVMVFNPQIQSIRLIDKVKGEDDFYTVQTREKVSQHLQFVKVIKNQQQKIYMQASKDQYTSICIELEQKQHTFQIQSKPWAAPILYADFPLIGSEDKFTFPCYLNSHIFWPNEERSSIQIIDKPRYKHNQTVLKESVKLIEILFKYAISQNWENLHCFAQIRSPLIQNAEWFKQNVLYPIMQCIASQPIVHAIQGKKTLMEVIFPSLFSEHLEYKKSYGQDMASLDQSKFEALWTILLPFFSNKLIANNYDYSITWKNLLHSEWYAILPKQNNVSFHYILDKINAFTGLRDLQQVLRDEGQDWRKNVYSFIMTYLSQDCISDIKRYCKLFLNQKDQFCYCKELYVDQNIEEIYKDLCAQYGYNLYSILLSNNLQDYTAPFFELHRQTMDFIYVSCEIQKALKHNPSSQSYRHQETLKLTQVQGNTYRQANLINDLVSMIPADRNEPSLDFTLFKEERKKMYDLVEQMIQLPKKTYVKQYDTEIYSFCDKKLISDITSIIQSSGNLENLKRKFIKQFDSEIDVMHWITAYYLRHNILNGSLQNKTVMLNQQSQFCCCQELEMRFDEIQTSIESLISFKPNIKEKLIENLELIRELYTSEVEFSLTRKLVHPDVAESLKTDILVSRKIQSMDIKEVLNALDRKITTSCNQIDYVTASTKIILQFDIIYRCLEEDDDLLSEMLPQFKSKYKEIIFLCMNNGKTKEIVTDLYLKGGEQFFDNLQKLKDDDFESLNELVTQIATGQKTLQEFKAFLLRPQPPEPSQPPQNLDDLMNMMHDNEMFANEVPGVQNRPFNLDEFLLTRCITSEDELERFIAKYNAALQAQIREKLRDQAAFEVVIKMLRRSVENVKLQLEREPDYDITDWVIKTAHINQNIIGGVKKFGVEMMILVRPTDSCKIIFHNQEEINTLKLSNSEIWGDNGSIARQFKFGEIIEWNRMYDFVVYS